MKDIEMALKKVSAVYNDDFEVVSVGENDKFKMITMANEQLIKDNDGMEYPYIIINKLTGDEFIGKGIDFTFDSRFDDLNLGDLRFIGV